jgi:hypothetical protein
VDEFSLIMIKWELERVLNAKNGNKASLEFVPIYSATPNISQYWYHPK